MNPITSFELLFFAVFGQTNTEQTITDQINNLSIKTQPYWVEYLFKIVFGVYMLVSIIVLINLLIAMMSDTYQRIQAQSDIEWKYGLSKLIRKMHRTTSEPSPLNLVTVWFKVLLRKCRKRFGKKKGGRVLEATKYFGRQSPRSKAATKWVMATMRRQQIEAARLALEQSSGWISGSDEGSKFIGSRNNVQQPRIDTVVDWKMVGQKYRELVGDVEEEDSRDHVRISRTGSSVEMVEESIKV